MPVQKEQPNLRLPSPPQILPLSETPDFPANYAFEQPKKCITSYDDVQTFLDSEAIYKLLYFIQCVNEACKDTKNSADAHLSDLSQRILNALNELSGWIDEIPPLESPQRFGNRAFKTWIDRMEDVFG